MKHKVSLNQYGVLALAIAFCLLFYCNKKHTPIFIPNKTEIKND